MPNKGSVLVTGGTGFIGSHLVEELVNAEYNVHVLSRSGKISNLKHLQGRYKLVVGDLGEQTVIDTLLKSIDYVFHLSWTTVPHTASASPVFDIQTNLLNGVTFLNKCIAHKVKKFFFISSGGTVYGEGVTDIPIKENSLLNPISAYGISKMSFEKYLGFYAKNKGFSSAIFRLSNVYGEKQTLEKGQGVVGIWLKSAIEKGEIEIWGDGKVVRDYIYVSDVAKVLVAAIEKDLSHSIYNVGSGKGISLKEIAEVLASFVDRKVHIKYKDARNFDVPINILDVSRLNAEIDIGPLVSIEEGIEKTYRWLLSKK